MIRYFDVVTAPFRTVGKPDLRKLIPIPVIPILDPDLLGTREVEWSRPSLTTRWQAIYWDVFCNQTGILPLTRLLALA